MLRRPASGSRLARQGWLASCWPTAAGLACHRAAKHRAPHPTVPAPAFSPPRESLLRLEVVAEGRLNAVAFWFDLHLDEQETLTNGAPDC